MKLNLLAKRQRGFGMLESIFSVAVGLIFVGGAVVLIQQANAGIKTSDTIRQMTSVASEVQSIYRTESSFGEAGAAINIGDATALPDLYLENMDVTGNGQEFTVAISGLSDSVCNRVALSDVGAVEPAEGETNPTCNTETGTVTATFGR